MKASSLMLLALFGLCVGPNAFAQLAQTTAPEKMAFLKSTIPYYNCLQAEFGKLITANFDDPDVYPLAKVEDEGVFAALKASCKSKKEAILATVPDAAAQAKALDVWEAEQSALFFSAAQRNRTRVEGWLLAIRVPGPRPAAPLIELILADDYPALAMRQEEQGRVLATYTVGTNGRVLDCKGEGATEALHNAACAVIVRRWRYAPALDAAGQRVAEVRTKAINFSLH